MMEIPSNIWSCNVEWRCWTHLTHTYVNSFNRPDACRPRIFEDLFIKSEKLKSSQSKK